MTEDRPLRVLLASDHYPPFIGGAHRQVRLLATHLARRGHAVAVATVAQPGFPRVDITDGVPVHRLAQLRTVFGGGRRSATQKHQPPFPDPVTVVALRRLIRSFRPDVVHAHGWFSFSCSLALAGDPAPLLLSARDYSYFCATRTLTYRGAACSGPSLGRCLMCSGDYYGPAKGLVSVLGVAVSKPLLARRVAGIHSVSRYTSDAIDRHFVIHHGERSGRPIERVILPSFMDSDESSDDDAVSVPGLPTQPFILFVGALRHVKGVDGLLEAYRRIPDAPPLVLIGTVERDGPQTFPAGVTVLAGVPHEQVLAAWDRALFGVVPSLLPEPLGSVVYEAMSRGRAVIGTRPGGHEDMIVDGETGLLVPSGDVDALVVAMQQLLDSPARCAQMGEAARRRATAFTASAVIPAFEATYRRIAARGR